MNNTPDKQHDTSASAQDRFEVVFNASLDGILIVGGEDRRVLSANPAACLLLGCTREQLVGKPYSEIYDPQWEEDVRGEEGAHDGFDGGVLEYQVVRTVTGELRRVDLTLNMIAWEGAPAFLVTLRDSESRLAAAEASERARREAIETVRLKAAFLANMSHEIRTPLNGIIGMTDLLLDSPLDGQQQEFTETIRSCGENLLSLINDILDLSKFESGRIELEQIDFDLRVCMEEALDMVAARAQLKGLEVALSMDPGMPSFVRGDRTRLQQVLLNLLSNAVKFTERGQVALEAKLLKANGMEVRVHFTVRDTGIGISSAVRERIFQPFQQGDASITRKYGGTGLGLAITSRIVEALGGTVTVESEPEHGSAFQVEVPLIAVADPGHSVTTTHLRQADLRGLRALVVDPGDLSRRVVAQQLRVWGCHVVEAATMDEAWTAARVGKPFDVSLMELGTHGLTPERIEELREQDQTTGFGEVIILSSIPARKEAERLRAFGVSGLLLKPVRNAVLHDTILTVLDKTDGKAGGGERKLVTSESLAEARHMRGRLLLVEDDKVNQRVATLLLKKGGFECDVVSDGVEALEACARRSYDIVLMDCQMPRMDGFTATRELRARETPPQHITIIAMTANAMEGDRERCIEAGMDDYIKKPVQAKQLYDVLATHLGNRDRARNDAIPPATAPSPKKETAPSIESPCDDEPLFDPQPLQSLSELVGGTDDALILDMVRDFIEEVPEAIARMRAGLDAGDIEAAGSVAHMFESRTGNVGARRVQALCNMIQIRWRKQQPEGMRPLIDAMERAHAETVPLLRQAYPATP
ncbi:MAG: two-component system, sensor histidine kinase and response regulator [Candidatus Sumerlaeota bacterium]|nr:two-component system, sensor histidine kinase and response regulator [Candidatus Sumerlaeota bacterium]